VRCASAVGLHRALEEVKNTCYGTQEEEEEG
jgi:hypothetical protein